MQLIRIRLRLCAPQRCHWKVAMRGAIRPPSAASAWPFVKTLGLYASQSRAFIEIVYRVLATPWPEIANAQGGTFMLSRHQSFEL